MGVHLLSIALSSFLLGLSGALSPGPLLTLTIAESIKRGPWVGPLLILGHAVLEFALIVAIVFGFDAVLRIPLVQIVMMAIGSVMLVFMALLTWRSSKEDFSKLLDVKISRTDTKLLRFPLTGIYMSISNPFWTIWWATVGVMYLGIAIEYKWWGIMFFFAGHILADFVWYTLVSFSLSKGRRFISPKWYRNILIGCACVLFLFAGFFLYLSVNRTMGLLHT